jgi:D-aminoacyl-tRNA deacylase
MSMNFAIICSKQDPAGMNIRQNLIDNHGFKESEEQFEGSAVFFKDNIKLYTAERPTLDCDNVDKDLDGEIIVFATRHQSEKGTASLCIHTPGNWGKADMGGRDKQICNSVPLFVREGFLTLLKKAQGKDIEVTNECTHHGPFIEKPCFFIEIGSDEDFWTNPEYGKINAEVIIELLGKKIEKGETKIAFGIGGPHYCNNFNRVIIENDLAVGHVCPKYALGSLDEEMIKQAMDRSDPKPDFALLDWKGLGGHKQRIVGILDELRIEAKRTKDF